MAELPKRILGRTGFAATILGYGAMELRGAPAYSYGREYSRRHGEQPAPDENRSSRRGAVSSQY